MARGYDPALFEPLADIEADSFWFRARNRLIVSVLRRRFPGLRSFLDVGCGAGAVLALLREELPGLRLVGTDLFAEALRIARERIPDAELLQLDARELPFESEFDVAGAFDVIEHIDEDELVLERMAYAVVPGGGVMLLVPQHPSLWSRYDRIADHLRRYTRRELVRKVGRAGLQVEFAGSFVSTLLPAMYAKRLYDRVRRRPYDVVAELRPGRLNPVFDRVLEAERRLVERGVSLPFGGSLLLVARKPE